MGRRPKAKAELGCDGCFGTIELGQTYVKRPDKEGAVLNFHPGCFASLANPKTSQT